MKTPLRSAHHRRRFFSSSLLAIALGLLISRSAEGFVFPASITVPVVAEAAGASGEFFRTSIAISNRGATSVFFYVIAFPEITGDSVPYSSCNRDPRYPTGQEVTPGATVVIGSESFRNSIEPDPAKPAVGFLEVTPSDPSRLPDLVVRTRIYAETAEGTFGQEIPSIRGSEGFLPGERTLQLFGLQKDASGTRTNVGIFIPPSECGTTGGAPASVRLSSFWSNGQQNSPSLDIEATVGGITRIDDVFGRVGVTGACEDCRIAIFSPVNFFAYASIVDGGTSDPTFVAGQPQ